jgi:hypothetical protein
MVNTTWSFAKGLMASPIVLEMEFKTPRRTNKWSFKILDKDAYLCFFFFA